MLTTGGSEMTPIKFKGVNVTYAENQPEYIPLPVHKTAGGEVISCWAFTWRERFKILLRGCMWYDVHTFNQPLQPQLPTVDKPDWIDYSAGAS
jgi:hypothetical protein